MNADHINMIAHTFAMDDVFFLAYEEGHGYALAIEHCTGSRVFCIGSVDNGVVRLWEFSEHPADVLQLMDKRVDLVDYDHDQLLHYGSVGAAIVALNPCLAAA